MDMIPVIDLRLLTQAELNTLALSYSASLPASSSRCDDVVVPKIDRSVFNESAGSRKQTYSRLRLAPPKSSSTSSTATPSSSASGRRRGRPRSVGVSTPATPTASATAAGDGDDEDSGRKENEQIVGFLRQLFAKNGETLADSINMVVSNPNPIPKTESVFKLNGEPQRRGRKKRPVTEEAGARVVLVDGSGDRETLNVNGLAVDLVGLGEKDELFGDEIKKRTAGLVTEVEFLEFLNGLDGQWGSSRKRRKIVDAGCFGDGLPKGWKLLLGLKRKEGSVWVHCRRYISPSGKHFTSCKEISSYVLSLVGSQGTTSSICVKQAEGTLISEKITSGHAAGITSEEGNRKETISCPLDSPTSISAKSEKLVSITKVENSAKAQLLNLLECQKCNIKFPDKDAHVQHLLSFHQRSAKRCRLGKSISSGVIIKDGKYECQFCHKTFIERRRYNGHVGIHVRNYSQSLELLTDEVTADGIVIESSSLGELPLAIEGNSAEYVFNTEHKPIGSVPDSTLDNSIIKSLDGLVSIAGGTGEKSGSYNESSVAMDSEHHKCLDDGLRAMGPAVKSTCEISNIIVHEPSVEPCKNSKPDWITSCSGENEKPQMGVQTSIARDSTFSKSLDATLAPTSGASEVTYVTSISTLNYNQNKVHEDFRSVNEISTVNQNSDSDKYSEYVSVTKRVVGEKTNDKDLAPQSFDDQIYRCNAVEGKPRKDAGTGSAAFTSIDCHPENNAPVTTHETSKAFGDNHSSSYKKIDDKFQSVDETNNTRFDACVDSNCNSSLSAMDKHCKNQSSLSVGGQFDINNIEHVKSSYSNELSSCVDSKNNVSMDFNNSLPVCAGKAPHETLNEGCAPVNTVINVTENRFGEHNVVREYHLGNLSCSRQSSTVNDKTEKSLCEPQLLVESNLSSQQGTGSQSCNVQTSAVDNFASNEGQVDIVDTDTYGNENWRSIRSGGNQAYDMEAQIEAVCQNSIRESNTCKMKESCSELVIDLGFGLSGSNKDSVADAVGIIEGGAVDSGSLNKSSPWLQPSTMSMIPDQDMNKIVGTQQKQEYASGLDDLRLDIFGSSDPIMVVNQAAGLRPEDSLGLAYNEGLINAFVPPVQLGWDMAAPDMVSRHEVTSIVCMWCGEEFSQEDVTLQPQSDTIGFICSTCKSKISGQLKF